LIISGSTITDLANNATRDITPGDYVIHLDPNLVVTMPLVQPVAVSATASSETVQTSFMKANLSLALAPATGQTITDFVQIVAGYWEFTFMVSAWFDYVKAAADPKAFALAFLPTDTGQTTQFLGLFAVIGTQSKEITFKLLSRKGGTFRAVLGPTQAAQNISATVSCFGNRIL